MIKKQNSFSQFLGVYFEWMLKDGSKTPFWIRNLQMYSCGVVSAAVGCFLSEWDNITAKGFFHGYNSLVVAIVLFLSLGKLFAKLCIGLQKYRSTWIVFCWTCFFAPELFLLKVMARLLDLYNLLCTILPDKL